MHTECPLGAKEIIEIMPTDEDIDLLYEKYGSRPKESDVPALWGDGIVWEEFHHKTRYPYAVD